MNIFGFEMSGSRKKLVQFEAADKAKGKDNKIPTSVAPDAVQMPSGPDGAERTAAAFSETELRQRDATDEQFPTAALNRSDEGDVVQSMKLELQKGQEPGITPFGQLIASDSDFKWLQKKRDQEAEADFQAWFAQNFDKMSPEQKKMARELWPDFYQQRLELLDKDLDLLRRIARQNVTGIQSKEDLLLQYALEAGFIDGDRLENLMHPEKAEHRRDDKLRQASYVRGLMNPKRLPAGNNFNNRSDNSMSATGRAKAAGAASLGISTGFHAQPQTDVRQDSSQFRALLKSLPVGYNY